MAMRKAEWFWLKSKEDASEHPEPVTESEIAEVEKRLGVKLPDAYLTLFRLQGSGYSEWNVYWDPEANVCWAGVFLDGPSEFRHLETMQQFADGIDFGGGYSWGEILQDMHLLVVIASHGCDWLTCLDYRRCGPMGEPEVVEVDAVSGPQIFHRVESFSTLLSGLCLRARAGFEIALNARKDELPQLLNKLDEVFATSFRPAPHVGENYVAESGQPDIASLAISPNTTLYRRLLPDAEWLLTLAIPGELTVAQTEHINAWLARKLDELGGLACVLGVPEQLSSPEDRVRQDTPEFIATILQLHQRRAEAGDIAAMQMLAKIYEDRNDFYAPKGYPVDQEAAQYWFARALETMRAGTESEDQETAAVSMRCLGDAFQQGNGVMPDLEEALRWYEMAAERQEYWAMIALGRIYIGDVHQDFERAEYWLQKAKKLWDASFADDVLKELERKKQAAISTRDGINEDNVDYVLDQAAEGDARAMLQVAQCCLDGRFGFSEDVQNAIDWLERAVAQYTSLPDDAAANEPLRYVAREAAAKLADLYSGSRHFQGNPAVALRWSRQAAWLGSRENMIYIALGLTDGSLDRHDPVQAYAWAEIARRPRYDDDDQECLTLESTLNYLRDMLDSTQLDEANALIAQCADCPPYLLPDDFRGRFRPADSIARIEPPELSTIPRDHVRRRWDEMPGRADYEHAAQCVAKGDWIGAQDAFVRAAQAGHVGSMIEIAKMYAAGNGGEVDELLAARWYYLAAGMQDDASAKGSSAAMAWLGYACIRGSLQSGASDPVTGYVWYALASRPRYNYTDMANAPYVEKWLMFIRDQQARCATLLTEVQQAGASAMLDDLDVGPPFRLPAGPWEVF